MLVNIMGISFLAMILYLTTPIAIVIAATENHWQRKVLNSGWLISWQENFYDEN